LIQLLSEGNPSAGQGVGGHPEARRPPSATPPSSSSGINSTALDASSLYELYEAILERYVDPVEPARLIDGALRGFRSASADRGLLPVDAASLEIMPFRQAGSTDLDWIQFAGRYDALLEQLRESGDAVAVGRAVADGMLGAVGDPHTRLILAGASAPPQSGGRAGIGVVISAAEADGLPFAAEVQEGSSAERAGIQPGDAILRVDGRPTDGLEVAEVARLIQGRPGTQTMLEVASVGQASPRAVRAEREVSGLPPVKGSMQGGVAYVRIRSFQSGVAAEVRRELTRSAEDGVRAWVLDLRGNSGGSLQEVTGVASVFIGDGIVAVQVDRPHGERPVRGSGLPVDAEAEVVVLVDRDTGSGAELLAAALQEHGAARVVGARTAGRVGISSTTPLADGSVAQITIQRFLTPGRQRLDRTGVRPDALAASDRDDWASGRDRGLEEALGWLHARGHS
jgi:carboxyl-terminal processing protease